jgi:hypothetical protein
MGQKRLILYIFLIILLFNFLSSCSCSNLENKKKHILHVGDDIELSVFLSTPTDNELEIQEKKILADLSKSNITWRIYRVSSNADIVYPSTQIYTEDHIPVGISPAVGYTLEPDFAIEKGFFHNKCIMDIDNIKIDDKNIVFFKIEKGKIKAFPPLYNNDRTPISNDFLQIIIYDKLGIYRKFDSMISKMFSGLIYTLLRGVDPDLAEHASDEIYFKASEREKLEKRVIFKIDAEELLSFIKEIEVNSCIRNLK